jgi:hypothetical protein
VVIFGVWAIWPGSIVPLNDWLSRFRFIRAMAHTPPEGRPRPSDRRIRVVAGVGVVLGIVLLIAGLLDFEADPRRSTRQPVEPLRGMSGHVARSCVRLILASERRQGTM